MLVRICVFAPLFALLACVGQPAGDADGVGLRAGPGVDVANKVVRVGLLNDYSGPIAALGKALAAGIHMAVEQANAEGSALLPDGWKIELIERDHGYNPQRSVQEYNALRDEVLFLAMSVGSPTTLPLRPLLARDKLVAFPGSLASAMADHEYTPLLGPSYKIEAMRAMDWAVELAAEGELRAAIVYQQDDYGQDGLDGWRHAAAHHGVSIVSEQGVSSTQTDYTAVVATLKSAGANYVMLSVIPSAAQSILGIAKQLKYEATWLGQGPSWLDRFFDPSVAPPAIFDNYYVVHGWRFWAENVSGMDTFRNLYERFGKAISSPEWLIILAYAGTRAELQVLRRALEQGDVTREGFFAALRSGPVDTGGLIQSLDFSTFPYEPSISTRVLRPRLSEGSWEVVSDFADPLSHQGRH